jgi:hypothetical protein
LSIRAKIIAEKKVKKVKRVKKCSGASVKRQFRNVVAGFTPANHAPIKGATTFFLPPSRKLPQINLPLIKRLADDDADEIFFAERLQRRDVLLRAHAA